MFYGSMYFMSQCNQVFFYKYIKCLNLIKKPNIVYLSFTQI